MIIAIDFDGTWTEAPFLWSSFVELCVSQGHKAIIATARKESDPVYKKSQWDGPADILCTESGRILDVVYCGNSLKKDECLRQGFKVDIWIDDNPGMIERCKVLEDSPEDAL